MKKTFFYLSILLIVFASAGCKKDKDLSSQKLKLKKMEHYNIDGSFDEGYVFHYAGDKISKVDLLEPNYENGEVEVYFSFIYNYNDKGQLTEVRKDPSNSLLVTYEYQADEMVEIIYDPLHSYGYKYQMKDEIFPLHIWSYNKENGVIIPSDTRRTDYIYENGNCVKKETYNNEEFKMYADTFEYDKNANPLYGLNLFGIRAYMDTYSICNITKSFSGEGEDAICSSEYTYTYNSNGYPIQRVSSTGGYVMSTTTYTYE